MKIAILGPSGTYSDIASDKFLSESGLQVEKEFYPSILKTALAVNSDTIAILPFENTLDGFVMESLDRIIMDNLWISKQVKLSIDFAFVTNAKSIKDVKTVFCQFKAYGQCIDFIGKQDFTIIKTDSNVQSKNMLDQKDSTYGAIIPSHLVNEGEYNIVIHHIADSKKNETRFFVVESQKHDIIEEGLLNTSIIVYKDEDRPGLLYEILSKFQSLGINLNSILSRPSRENLGRYNFYMECSLMDNEMRKLDSLVEELSSVGFEIDILGVYKAL